MAAFGGIPQAVSGELVRPRLIELLDGRFDVALTLVTAGAGFGKSTALAQAIRHHQLAPAGIDVWLTCSPGDEHAGRLGRRLLHAIGAAASFSDRPLADAGAAGDQPPATGDADRIAATIVSALVDCSPLQVCVALDDCHVLGDESSGARLLTELIRALPANAHIVLAGRTMPTLPLARLRAAESVREIGQEELAFTPEECTAAAAMVGKDAPDADLGGWPALVRLSLLARRGAARDYLAEEVLAGATPATRDTLLALTLLGPSTAQQVEELLGRPPDIAGVANLPMVSVDADGRYHAHLLWQRAVIDGTDQRRLDELSGRVTEALVGRREYARAGAAALARGDLDAIDRLALDLVRNSMSTIPVETAAGWVEAIPADRRSTVVRLLDALVRHTRTPGDATIGPTLEQLAAEAVAARRPDIHAATLAVAALSAHAQADFGRLFSLAAQAAELPETENLLVLRLLRTTIDAIGCDLRGDPEGALAAMDELPWDEIGRRDSNTAARLYLQAMWMSGQSARATEFCDRWYRDPARRLGTVLGDLSRWFDGDPSGFADNSHVGVLTDREVAERDRFVGACYAVVMLASTGETAGIEHVWTTQRLADRALANARDSAHVTNAAAARLIAQHHDAGAAAVIAEHFRRYPLEDALGERHMRRWPALAYVLHDAARRHWEGEPFGPSHDRARRCAQALLAARSGRAIRAPAAPALFTQLPLPWSTELACRWQALGDPQAAALAALLHDRVAGFVDELRRLADGDDPTCRRGAAALLRTLPAAPAVTLEIDVIGPLQVRIGGQTNAAAELRRGRVRQLLSVLVAERTVRRDRAIELLWPDLGADAAATNLRVTLTHLRRLLEPDRPAGEPGFHLRTDSNSIALHPSAHLRIDAWEAEQFEREARAAGADTAQQIQSLEHLVGAWRGEPFVDLSSIPTFDSTRERIHLRHVAALRRLGELSLAVADSARAAECAAQALDLEPFDEQAHRLAIAAQLQRRDAEGTHRALERLRHALGDLGVDAEPPTEVLRRSADGWLQRLRGAQPVAADR